MQIEVQTTQINEVIDYHLNLNSNSFLTLTVAKFNLSILMLLSPQNKQLIYFEKLFIFLLAAKVILWG